MNLQIIKPDRELYKGVANSLVIPGLDGLIGILNNHAPMIASLKQGTIKVETEKETLNFDVKGGVAEVLHNQVIILAE